MTKTEAIRGTFYLSEKQNPKLLEVMKSLPGNKRSAFLRTCLRDINLDKALSKFLKEQGFTQILFEEEPTVEEPGETLTPEPPAPTSNILERMKK